MLAFYVGLARQAAGPLAELAVGPGPGSHGGRPALPGWPCRQAWPMCL
jgi:hypothetical protein